MSTRNRATCSPARSDDLIEAESAEPELPEVPKNIYVVYAGDCVIGQSHEWAVADMRARHHLTTCSRLQAGGISHYSTDKSVTEEVFIVTYNRVQ